MSQSNEDYKKANKILTKLSKTMNWLLANDIEDVNIEYLLGSFGKVLDVNRSYVFKKFGDTKFTCYYKQIYEWTDGIVSTQINNDMLQNISCYDDGVISLHEVLINDEPFVGNVSEMTKCIRDILEAQSIVSIAIIPIFVDNILWGFVGFDDCFQKRCWSELEINALYALGVVIRTIISKIEHNNRRELLLSNVIDKMKRANLSLENTNMVLESQIRNVT